MIRDIVKIDEALGYLKANHAKPPFSIKEVDELLHGEKKADVFSEEWALPSAQNV